MGAVSKLVFSVEKLTGLGKPSCWGDADTLSPYVEVSFGESTVYTSVVHGSANPEYGEKFTISEGGRPQMLKLKVYTVVKHGAVDLVLGQGTLPVDTMQNDYDFTIPLVDGALVTGKAHIYIQTVSLCGAQTLFSDDEQPARPSPRNTLPKADNHSPRGLPNYQSPRASNTPTESPASHVVYQASQINTVTPNTRHRVFGWPMRIWRQHRQNTAAAAAAAAATIPEGDEAEEPRTPKKAKSPFKHDDVDTKAEQLWDRTPEVERLWHADDTSPLRIPFGLVTERSREPTPDGPVLTGFIHTDDTLWATPSDTKTFKRAVRSSVARIRQHGQARGGGGIRWSRVLQHVSLLADLYLLYRLPEIMRAVGRVVGRRGDGGTTEFRRRRTYVVREGDTLSKIARRHRIKLPTLLSKNEGLRSEHFIRVGERLFL